MTTTASTRELPPSSSHPRTAIKRSAGLVIALAFVALVFDGYDLVVYGTIVQSILDYEAWGLTTAETGAINSFALVGMALGSLTVGYLTDLIGRRKVLIGAVTFFSILMIATALAPTPELFGLFRFLSGIGLGGVIPTAVATTVEFSRPGRKNFNNALMFSGYSVGGIIAALLAIWLVDTIGFRGMLSVGALPLVTIVPLLIFLMPESPAYLRAKGRVADADRIIDQFGLTPVTVAPSIPGAPTAAPAKKRNSLLAIFTGRWALITGVFLVAAISGQILIYGLNTWLPKLLTIAGYSLTSSLSFLLVTNAGAVIGSLIASPLADRFGAKRVVSISFGLAGTALFLMALGFLTGDGSGFPLGVTYLLVAIVGFGSIGAQILLNGFIATYYTDATRGTALGTILAVGRAGAAVAIALGGALIAAELSNFVNFAVWAIPAVIGAVMVLSVPRRKS
ncbi:MFS transporter [Pseudoclavibacter helvolus]|uniref:MFS transporter n=1 Tax=Pseudoclavibacter helvolus TaxID=255205 RepID=UPI0024AE31ED|nr:MFS transporter [Pseudoclavibacter helvolus]